MVEASYHSSPAVLSYSSVSTPHSRFRFLPVPGTISGASVSSTTYVARRLADSSSGSQSVHQ